MDIAQLYNLNDNDAVYIYAVHNFARLYIKEMIEELPECEEMAEDIANKVITQSLESIHSKFNQITLIDSHCARSIISANNVDAFAIIEYINTKPLNRRTEYIRKYCEQDCAIDVKKFFTEIFESELSIINIRAQQKVELKTCTQFYCRKCQANETTVHEYQGRASDEASTLSITCVKCGYNWRKSG